MERYFGAEELDALSQVIEGQELCRLGIEGFVSRFEDQMGQHLGRRYVYAVNSGTSANEAMVAGLGLQPGDEVICPGVCPIFVSIPVLAVGCIPVFADVDPRTLIISSDGIKDRVSERTKAVVVVHHYGQPAPMDEIMAVAGLHDLKVLEDCAQAYDVYYRGQQAGTFGDAACFSLQSSKHITSGEGGFIATDDSEIYKRAELYSNCGMPWFRYGLQPDQPAVVAGYRTRGHFSFGHNHRMGELQGAVALVQLAKIERFNAERVKLVRIIEETLRHCPGIMLAHSYDEPHTRPNYWLYPLQLNPQDTALTAREVHRLCLEEEGIGSGYFNDTVNYLEHVFQVMQRERRTPFGYPLPDTVTYEPGLCPRGEEVAKRIIPINVHHGRDLEGLRRQVQALRNTLMRHVGP